MVTNCLACASKSGTTIKRLARPPVVMRSCPLSWVVDCAIGERKTVNRDPKTCMDGKGQVLVPPALDGCRMCIGWVSDGYRMGHHT